MLVVFPDLYSKTQALEIQNDIYTYCIQFSIFFNHKNVGYNAIPIFFHKV